MHPAKNDPFMQAMSDPYWRLNHLYHIISKRGLKIPFKMNWAQTRLYDDMHYCNIVLKARQLGISTFVCLFFLDKCLFNDNISAGVIAHTREDAELLFKRIKGSYDYLPDSIKGKRKATTDSARELVFSNGSSIRVGTSMRGTTLQYLHISEFGKICAKYPDKAVEIITGSLNTVAPGQYIFIESTAEGKEGPFYEMSKRAQSLQQQDSPLSELDYKFHFFPWWKEPSYRIGSPIVVTEECLEYFRSLESRDVFLDSEQKNWYAAAMYNQGEHMTREYPSTPDEAWEQSNEGCYYSKQMIASRLEKRICHVPYDDSLPVHTAWDLGYNDSTAIILFQLVRQEIHVIDYLEGSGESLAHWLGELTKKTYAYGKHLAPHDIMAHEFTSGMTRQSSARKMGYNLIAVPKVGIINGIDKGRNIFARTWFDEKRCIVLLKSLENYKKEWDDKHGCWRENPLHNWASHASDAWRTLATGLHIVTGPERVEGKTLGFGQGVNPHSHPTGRYM